MNKKIVIRENINAYMQDLKNWIKETENINLESMVDFFKLRINCYEEHMRIWHDAYKYMVKLIPCDTNNLLDLGCGTGLEIDEIVVYNPDIKITGIDMSDEMLIVLKNKHPKVNAICADYFQYDFGIKFYDIVISFQTLHHFKPNMKKQLFIKIYNSLKNGGKYIQADYIACCQEEETLLMEVYDIKRKKENIPDNLFVHFDIPLTAEHEIKLLYAAGFDEVELINCINGVCFIIAEKLND